MHKRFNRRHFLELSAGVTAATALGTTPILAPQTARAAMNSMLAFTPVTTPRQVLNFNTNWLFYRGDVSGAQVSSLNDNAWELVNLPHTVRLENFINSGGLNYQGLAWYRRHFALDNTYSGKKILVRFEGAMQVADVWINGTSLGEHQGGFTPFIFDITSYVTLNGSENVLAVKLNNLDNGNVPPGKPEKQLDFNYFGGLYRGVSLIVVDPLHITDPIFANQVASGGVFVTTPAVSSASATIHIQTHIQNDGAGAASTTVKSTLVDASGTIVATAQSTQTINAAATGTFTQSVIISNPHLWSPDSPYLYTVYSEVDNGTTAVDSTSTRIGIRSINFSKANGFTLNGQPFQLDGTNRGHQEYPYLGFAVPASGQYRDALLLKAGGANFVRSAHYPPDPAFLDACDELGIMVLDAIPGWQYYSSNAQFVNDSYNDVRTMIRRDRNHPAVILWEASLNETNMPDAYAQMTTSITHAEYPGNQTFTYGGNTAHAGTIFDVQNASYSTTGTAALLVREYGDWDFGGEQSTSRSTRANGEAAMLTAVSNKKQDYNSNLTPNANYKLVGQATWCGFDYNRGKETFPHYGGLVDLFRIPKFVYYFYQSQRNPNVTFSNVNSGPMAYIANWWTATSPKDVTVFSNCTKVNLYLNNTLIASRSPDTGTNNTHVPHPPFTFTGLTWQAGTLRADGLINNKVVASHSVSTPGSAYKVVVTIDTANRSLVADGADLAIVQASVVDQAGTVIPTNSIALTFAVTGAGTLIGDSSIGANPVTTGAGISAALVRTTTQAGQIIVTASATGLLAGNASVTSIASTAITVPTTGTSSGIDPNAWYQIVNKNSGLLLDVTGASTSAGAQIIQSTSNGQNDQLWRIVANGSGRYTITNKLSGDVLDISGQSTLSSVKVVQNVGSSQNSQLWTITGVANDGYYKILNVNSGQALDVTGKSKTSGAPIDQYPYKDGDPANQLWSLVHVQDAFDGTAPYTLVNRNSGKLLDIAGAIAVQNASTGQSSQQWTITNLGNGYYKILNKNSGQALEDAGSSNANGATIDQAPYSSGTNQQWQLIHEGSGYYTLINHYSSQSLDVAGRQTTNGAPIVQWPYQGTINEQWSIVHV